MPAPATFNAQTEYQRNYKGSIQTFKADSRIAGAPSSVAAKFTAPGLQTKKRVQQSLPHKPVDDDYVLLGQQEKFANNIRYRSKSQDRKYHTIQPKSVPIANGVVRTPSELSTPLTPRGDPPVVNFDPGQPIFPVKQGSPKNAAVEAKLDKAKVQQPKGNESKQHVKKKSNLVLVERGVGDEPVHEKVTKTVQTREKNQRAAAAPPAVKISQAPAPQPRPSQSAAAKASKGIKPKAVVNDSVQTDLDRGVLDSKYEAPNYYAMQYKNKVAPSRPKAATRMTEYERNYVWRKSLPNTPLLAAEAIVYKSQLKDVLKGQASSDTEYKRQYRPWSLLKSTPDLSRAVDEARTPSLLEYEARAAADPAGGKPVVDEDDKRLIKESSNPFKPFFPHGKDRMKHSEYESNYRPPWKFDVKHGAWKGASPPQVLPEEEIQSSQSARAHRPKTAPIGLPNPRYVRSASPPPVMDDAARTWFREVMELRRRATEYKKRALGTHFSREHLAQLYAPRQDDVWDGEPTPRDLTLPLEQDHDEGGGGDTLVGGSLADDQESVPGSAHSLEHHHHGVQDRKANERKEAWGPSQQVEKLKLPTSRTPSVRSRASSTVSPTTPAPAPQEKLTRSQKVNTARPKSAGSKHHLDRTTPASDGELISHNVILQNYKSVPPRQPSPTRGVSTSPVKISKSGPSPTFGMPTRDTHKLVDEDSRSDRTLELQYVGSGHISPAKRAAAAELSTIPEAGAQTYTVPSNAPPPPTNPKLTVTLDDIPPHNSRHSVSTASVASSCSLASEILERARKRRDEFWGNEP